MEHDPSQRYNSGRFGQLVQTLEDGGSKCLAIWDLIGYPDSFKRDMIQQTEYQLCQVVLNTVQEAEANLNDIKRKIEELRFMLVQLAIDLDVEIPKLPENLSLLELQKWYARQCNELELEKIEQLKLIDDLRKIEDNLCRRLEVEALKFTREKKLPSKADFQRLEEYIDQLKDLTKQRKEELNEYVSEINHLSNDFEYSIDSEFGISLITDSIDDMPLSIEFIEDVRHFRHKLHEYVKQQARKGKDLMNNIFDLYKKLSVPEEDQMNFGDLYNKKTILKMQEELDRLKEERRKNISTIFANDLERMEELYTECMIPFTNIYADESLNEELIERMEVEIGKLEERLEVTRQVLEMIREWDVLWKRYMMLELKSNDASRFKNRGGQMLLDEKEKKIINRDLPKLQRNIENAIINFEREQNTMFKIHGQSFEEYINARRAELELSRELEKNAKEQKPGSKTNTKSMNSKYSSSATSTINETTRKRAFGATSTILPEPTLSTAIPKRQKIDETQGRTPLKLKPQNTVVKNKSKPTSSNVETGAVEKRGLRPPQIKLFSRPKIEDGLGDYTEFVASLKERTSYSSTLKFN